LDRSHVAGLACYGRHIGVAWQLAEDLAVFELPEERVPFLVGTAPVRPVYPVAWAGAKDPEVIRLWSKLKEEPSREEPELCEEELAEALAARVRGNGGLVAGRAAILKQVWSARQALGALPETSARAALDRIAAGIAAPSGLVQAA
jgi:geranylgeranyl pyrophosphate synthase